MIAEIGLKVNNLKLTLAALGILTLTTLAQQYEIDFVESPNHFIEVKRGKCSPIEFSWFAHQFPGKYLTVVNAKKFETDTVRGISIEEFLLRD